MPRVRHELVGWRMHLSDAFVRVRREPFGQDLRHSGEKGSHEPPAPAYCFPPTAYCLLLSACLSQVRSPYRLR